MKAEQSEHLGPVGRVGGLVVQHFAAGSKWFMPAPPHHNNIAVDNSNIQQWSYPTNLILSIQLFLNKA